MTKPEKGVWTHTATGDTSDIVFVEVQPDVFEPRLPDGNKIRFMTGDSMLIDALGPQQSVVIPTLLEADDG